MSNTYTDELLDEIEDLINLDRPQIEERSVPILFDGKQYGVKIPIRIAEKIGLTGEHKMTFKLTTSFKDGELVTTVKASIDEEHDTASE